MGGEGKILVVDDDPAVCEAITVALGRSFQIRRAHTGSAAIDAICVSHYDLVLLDYYLPDARGTDLLKLIKQFFPSTMEVIITALGSEAVAVEALRGGARDYLKKPINCRELLARVNVLFDARRGGTERRHNIFAQYMEKSAAAGQAAIHSEGSDRARYILRAIRHIDQKLDALHSLEAVARIAGMSKFHFCRHVQDRHGPVLLGIPRPTTDRPGQRAASG